jgi:chromosome partitioning protein
MIVSIMNNKGGVGKTTTAISTGVALSLAAKRVLVVDLDAQCNSTEILFGAYPEHLKNSLYDLLNPDEKIEPESAIYSTQYHGLSVLPNIAESAILGPRMIIHGEASLFLLRERLRTYALTKYDVTLIDCPPNLEAFVIAALIASDFVIVPTMAGSKFSINGLINAKAFIDDIKIKHNSDLKFLKLLITMADRRTSICNSAIKSIRQTFDSTEIFSQSIPVCTDFQKAEMLGKSIFGFNSSAAGARAYMNVANEMLDVLRRETK